MSDPGRASTSAEDGAVNGGEPLRLIYRIFDGFDRSFGEQVAAFRQARPEVTFELEALDVPPLHAGMIAGGGCRRGDYDLFLAVTDWLPELMRDGHLRPLDSFLAADPPPDWPDGWPATLRDLQTGPDGTIYGLPYHDGPEVFTLRADGLVLVVAARDR